MSKVFVLTAGRKLRGRAALALPAWLADAAVHEWIEILGTTHAGSPADATDDPEDAFCRSNKRLSYSNLVVCGTEIVLAAVGGHGDYSGNEVTGVQMNVDAPDWALRKDRTASVTDNADTNASDDTPTSRHTYNSTHYSSTNSRLMLHFTRAYSSNGSGSTRSFGFNLATNTWDASSTWGTGNYSASCKDSSDNCWSISNSSGHKLYKWTAATNGWAETYSAASGAGNTLAYDSVNNRLLALTWGDGEAGGSGTVGALYTSGGTARTVLSFAGSGLAAFEAATPNYASLVYDPDGDRFLFLAAGATVVYQITISGSTATITVRSTTGDTLPASVYSHGRMAYVPALKCVVAMPAGNLNLYGMRLA